MKNLIKTLSVLMILLLLTACSQAQPRLMGFYQSDIINGECVQISIFADDNRFVEYISNRQVNTGTYVATQDSTYKFDGDLLDFTIVLSSNNTFEVLLPQLNGEEPIMLNHIDKVPTTFSTDFTDVEKYKGLLK